MLNIVKGKIDRALKVVIYGSEGIGKSTFASQFPDPLFVDTEGGTAQMDVRRIEKPQSWDELINIVTEVAKEDVCQTFIIDTADWAEQLCVDYLCTKYKQNSIESFGYGKGYTYLAEEFSRLLKALDLVIVSGKHVVVTAHAKMRKFEQPDEMGAYDRWEMKLSKQVAPLLKEWCDMLLFLNYKTYVVTSENNTQKAQGGKRVMYTSHHPCWDAKNRHGLPEEMDLQFSGIAQLFKKPDTKSTAAAPDIPPPTPTQKIDLTPLDTVRTLMQESKVTESDVQMIVARKGHYTEDVPICEYPERFLTGWVIKYWPQILTLINAAHTNIE